jgi:FKBP-type peptidyl-prolyl cis-trans isomerase FkpA
MIVVRVVRLLPVLVCLGVAAACGSNNPTSPSAVAFSQSDLRLGTGATAASGNSLTVNYTGWIYDPTKPDFKGIQFDSTAAAGPFTFTLGSGSVIKGWDQGLVGLKVGGIRQLIVPPSLAYGNVRNGAIPPNSALIFEIELLSLK